VTAGIFSGAANKRGGSNLAALLMGLETEYGLSIKGASPRESLDRSKALRAIFRLARERAHLPALNHRGYFFENGSLLYLDCGNHVEFATPECPSPDEVIRYQLAGERFLSEMAAEITASETTISEAVILKCNVDYSDESHSTWGCHESYLHRGDPEIFPRQLVPFLASRVVLTGSGGFNSLAPDLEFLLSPRVEFLTKAISPHSTYDRGIFHTKKEPLCKSDYNRLHLLCGESNCSETASFLKLGATALVVAMIAGGLRPGDGVELSSPLQAMRTFSRDPLCRQVAATVRGKPITALAVQQHYLACAEAHLGNDFMPPWASGVTQLWRSILARLEQGAPESVVTVLDWPLKLQIFKDRVRRQGFSWDKVVSRDKRSSKDGLIKKDSTLSCSAKDFESLREELFEIDMRFSQLGERGIFASLDRAGHLNHRIPGVNRLETAMSTPPSAGRARLRGECVKRFADRREEMLCDWDRLWDPRRNRVLDLSDPFETGERWRKLPENEADRSSGNCSELS